jgi:multicomponent Na+:H+ antiporter subunit E
MSPDLIKAAMLRFVLVGCIWVVLTGGSTSYWGLALGIVAAATAVSLVALPAGEWRWRLRGMLRFIPHFLGQSMLGGFDVARRALSPALPIQPGIVTYRMRMPPGPQQVFFVNTLSLQPGTAVVSIDGDRLTIHALDASVPVDETVSQVEERVAALFGVELGGGG